MTFICNRLIISLPLTVLDASANQIELFPTSLSALTTLRELNLSSNHITTIPDQARLLYAAYHTLFYFFFFVSFTNHLFTVRTSRSSISRSTASPRCPRRWRRRCQAASCRCTATRGATIVISTTTTTLLTSNAANQTSVLVLLKCSDGDRRWKTPSLSRSASKTGT